MNPAPLGSPLSPPPSTARLRLRPLRAADATALAEAFADDEAHRYYPHMRDPAAVERWISWSQRHVAEHGFGLWALEALDGGRFLGDAGITWQPVRGAPWLEIGYHLRQAERGCGYATEAARACLAHAFVTLQAERVASIVDPRNAASIAVARRVHAACEAFDGPGGRRLLFSTQRDGWWPSHGAAKKAPCAPNQ